MARWAQLGLELKPLGKKISTNMADDRWFKTVSRTKKKTHSFLFYWETIKLKIIFSENLLTIAIVLTL